MSPSQEIFLCHNLVSHRNLRLIVTSWTPSDCIRGLKIFIVVLLREPWPIFIQIIFSVAFLIESSFSVTMLPCCKRLSVSIKVSCKELLQLVYNIGRISRRKFRIWNHVIDSENRFQARSLAIVPRAGFGITEHEWLKTNSFTTKNHITFILLLCWLQWCSCARRLRNQRNLGKTPGDFLGKGKEDSFSG